MSSETKLLADNAFELLQMESLDADISETSPNTTSGEDSSPTVSDEENEDTSDDDLDSIAGGGADGDISMSDVSSDDDGMLSDDELDTADNDTEDAPSASSHLQVFNELKQMYTHRYEVPHKRLPKPHSSFLKYVLEMLKALRPDRFRTELRVSPHTFDCLVEVITNDPVFVGHSELSCQAPIQEQLAVALYRFGHNGNTAGLQSIANWAGIGKGTVELYTRRVMIAFLRPEFMRNAVHWPSDEEKRAAKKWVCDHSCKAWQNGWCFVDGTLVPLATRPYWYGESYFDRKCRYLLNVQVCLLLLYLDEWYPSFGMLNRLFRSRICKSSTLPTATPAAHMMLLRGNKHNSQENMRPFLEKASGYGRILPTRSADSFDCIQR